MKDRDLIRQLHAETPPRPADDPLREFLSLVTLRDHAHLLKLTIRKLHVGEQTKKGDLINREGALIVGRKLWWQRWPKVQLGGTEVYRIE